MIKRGSIFCFILFCLLINIASATPVLFFSDITSGPNTGGQDNNGAFVTIFGNNFGAARGSSYITVGGGNVSRYIIWGENNAFNPNLDMISFQLGSNAQTGNIVLHTSDGDSNPLPFTVRSAEIKFISTSGNDNNNGSYSSPWRTFNKIRSSLPKGALCYIRGGTYDSATYGTSGGAMFYISGSYPWGNGAPDENAPYSILGYPGETTIWQTSISTPFINSYVNGNAQVPMASNIVFANLIMDANNHESSAGWSGCDNNAQPLPNRVHNIRFVNLEVKNYLQSAQFGGVGFVGMGGHGGPVDDVQQFGLSIHDMDDNVRMDHLVYYGAGGNNIDLGWNLCYNLDGVNAPAADGYAGYGIQVYTSGDASYTSFTNLKVHDNIVYNSQGRGGINIADYVDSAQVYNNIIYDCGSTSSWPGYSMIIQNEYGVNPSNRYVYNNIIYDITSGSHSTAVLGLGGGRVQSPNYYLRNNIIYSQSGVPYQAINPNGWTYAPAIVSSNNLWFGNGLPPAGASSELNSNPLFTNPSIYDFHLQSSSPAINVGFDASSIVAKDFDGVLRPQGSAFDIGPYEYFSGTQQQDTTPPVISNGMPSGNLNFSNGTTSAKLNLTTNENASCRYSNFSNISYSLMTGRFSTLNGLFHNSTVSGLQDNRTYRYYIKCNDSSGNVNIHDYSLVFSVNSPPSAVYHAADTNQNSYLELNEIMNYVRQFKLGTVTRTNVLDGVMNFFKGRYN